MRKAIIIPCVVVSVLALALIVDLDYDRYGQRISEAAEIVAVEIDNSPKIKVNTGCADLYDQRVWLQEQFDNELGNLSVKENIENGFFEDVEELNRKYLEAGCTDSFINGEIVK